MSKNFVLKLIFQMVLDGEVLGIKFDSSDGTIDGRSLGADVILFKGMQTGRARCQSSRLWYTSCGRS